MLSSYYIITVLCLCVWISSAQNLDDNDKYYGANEPECLQSGGTCITATECLEISRAKPGLCPKQQAAGFECCYGLPKGDKRCKKHGGECHKKGFCKPVVQYREAQDCKKDEDCCILV